jgi:hypothetical protein
MTVLIMPEGESQEKPEAAPPAPEPSIEIVDTQTYGAVDALALIDGQGRVWRTFVRPWWDIASWLWWWLFPGDKKLVQVRQEGGKRTRIRAVKIADKHVRIGSPSK